jgi:hypothetical protein
MKIDPVISSLVIVLVGKILWDWFRSGRVEKGSLVTTEHCDEIREKCCLPQMKKDVGIMEKRLDYAEKRLDEGHENFKSFRRDISDIKVILAGIQGAMESFLKGQK